MRIEIRDELFDPWAETAHYERELERHGACAVFGVERNTRS